MEMKYFVLSFIKTVPEICNLVFKEVEMIYKKNMYLFGYTLFIIPTVVVTVPVTAIRLFK